MYGYRMARRFPALEPSLYSSVTIIGMDHLFPSEVIRAFDAD